MLRLETAKKKDKEQRDRCIIGENIRITVSWYVWRKYGRLKHNGNEG
jgi:hypothetical protein